MVGVADLPSAEEPQRIDTDRPHPVRIYDYWLGGKDNFAADRALGDKIVEYIPATRIAMRENRAFLGRAVRYLAAEAGVTQYLDIGPGLPTANNVHEVAQSVTPSSRVVYVDNDPQVIVHARALLTSSPEGRTAYVEADLRDPSAILKDRTVREVLDFGQPIALMLVLLLHNIPDSDRPGEIVRTLVDALPSGSYLVASHPTAEYRPEQAEAGVQIGSEAGVPNVMRDSGDFARLAFTGLELVPPGVVLVSEWHPTGAGPRPVAADVSIFGGVARKP
ncbi:MAG: SAM-dependent methyltransferase [Nocardiopsaceae bacterium]|nr:SAM-dependent methyltransferase [Nocardiopsaceae bacterium]